jgi:hypothetical protein
VLRSFVLIALLVAAVAAAAPAGAKKGGAYQTGFDSWHAADGGFASWERSGTTVASGGALQLAGGSTESDPYPAGGYYGGNFYNAGSYSVGEAVSPVIGTDFGYTEAIASWNADTPTGSWIETQITARIAGRWTKWFNLGIWAADGSTIQRHSVRLQGDTDGFVAVDTLVLNGKKAPPADAYRLKLRLFSANGTVPSVRNVSLAYSTAAQAPTTLAAGNPALWNRLLAVPECSQEIYPDGGEVWCSPTSTSMVLGRWGDPRPCEDREHEVVDGVFDWIYDGHGNWPFNTAYAATTGLEGYVARFASMAQVEEWIAAGVPVVISYAWKKSELDGVSISSSNGHLAVIVGFDAAGNPIVNDPAEPLGNDEVQRTYDRTQLETQWLSTSGGTAYLMYPPGHAVPALG